MRAHPALLKDARAYSREMIEEDFFSHDSSNGETFSAQLKRFDYEYRNVGENVAWGPLAPPAPRTVP